ncbi:MAG: hypothetical protein HQ502_09215 [Alphaproteobacteria bacterium]|nr:hypothetical protein [Alphaproteobacteria bacterium]
MSKRNWLPGSTLNGVLIGIVFSVCVFWVGLIVGENLGKHSQQENAWKHGSGTSEQSQSQRPLPMAIANPEKGNSARAGQTLSDDPKGSIKDDLHQQWRMAKAAEEQVVWVRAQFVATVVEIGAVAAALIAAFLAAKYAKGAVETSRQEVRAYVDMSHYPDGLVPAEGIEDAYNIKIKVTNHGGTPADVTAIYLVAYSIVGDQERTPPNFPIDHRGRPVNYYLTPSTHFDYTGQIKTGRSAGDEIRVAGYVDYTDAFGKNHRCGYGRVYTPGDTKNNLHFATEPGWNYDRRRRRGEGRGPKDTS